MHMRTIWSRPMRCCLALAVSLLLVLSLMPLPAFAAQASLGSGEAASAAQPASVAADAAQTGDENAPAHAPASPAAASDAPPSSLATSGTQDSDASASEAAPQNPASATSSKQPAAADVPSAPKAAGEAASNRTANEAGVPAAALSIGSLIGGLPASSGGAPVSALTEKLEAGTYTLTANLYVAAVDAPIGANVYLGDSNFPPLHPQRMNATLTAEGDGQLQLSIPVKQNAFTLQHIGDGAGVRVLSTSRGGSEFNYLGEAPAHIRYEDRIIEVVCALDNASGSYTFKNCIEYPAPLDNDEMSDAEANKYWDIQLGVDFSSAVKNVAGDFEKSYEDPVTGIKLTAKADEGSASIPLLSTASFSAAEVADSAALEAAKVALSHEFSATPNFRLYDMKLASKGAQVSFDDKAHSQVYIPTEVAHAALYRIEGGTAAKLATQAADAGVTIDGISSGLFALADADSATPWAAVKKIESSFPGVSLTYRSGGRLEEAFGGFDSLDAGGFYNAYFSRVEDGLFWTTAAKELASLKAYQHLDLQSLYALGFDQNLSMFSAGLKHAPWVELGKESEIALEGTVPAAAGSDLYLVSGTIGSGITSVQKIPASLAGGNATFNLASIDEQLTEAQLDGYAAMWNAASGLDYLNAGKDEKGQTPQTKIAYIAVAREAPTRIDKPLPASGLVYTGGPQQGVAPGEGYDLSIAPSGTDAGEYLAVATPKAGFAWQDGSEQPAQLKWSIAKAPLSAAYDGETVAQGRTPAFKVDVSGFVGGESAASAKGYAAPSVLLPEGVSPQDLAEGASYELMPSGGAAANYTFAYKGGKLLVTKRADLAPGTYALTANLSMPGQFNPLIKGLTVYANSPDNPFSDTAGNSPVLDENASARNAVPRDPESMNATLVVGEGGVKTLVLPIKNPVFTTQELGTCADLSNVQVQRVAPADASKWSYGSHATRIHKMIATLSDPQTAGMASYAFAGSSLYAVPLDLDISPAGAVALKLDVDYDSAKKVSDVTATPSLDGEPAPGPAVPGDAGTGGAGGTGASGGSGTSAAPLPGPGAVPAPGASAPGASVGGVPRTAAASVAARSATLAPGSYTVSANIWLSKQDTGLPLNPHLTSGSFPPMNPVQSNATLTVDSNGHARVSVPIAIQRRIMTVNSISGLNLAASNREGAGLSNITVDLGVIGGSTSVVTKPCTVDVTIGDLAMTIGGAIFGGVRNHTYPATFQMNLSGVPLSGGGAIPDAVKRILAGDAGTSGDGTLGTVDEAKAQAAEAAAQAKAGKPGHQQAAPTPTDAAAGAEEMLAANPALTFGLGVLSTLVVGGAAAGGVHAYRRRKNLVSQGEKL